MNRIYNLDMNYLLKIPEIDNIIRDLITEEDVKKGELFQISQKINEVSQQFEEVFEEIQKNENIPIAVIKEDIIPTIVEAAKIPHIFHLFKELQMKNEYTYRHNICVGVIATYIGKWIGLSEEDLSKLTLAATLHDIGKTMISGSILNKPGKLTELEYEEMKRHTIYGYRLIKKTPGLHPSIALTALQHHEREDGQGYPLGITGDYIHPFSKIVAIADIFHAMSSNRVYHEAIPFYEVIAQMKENIFGKLDPEILLVFLNKMMGSLVGKDVKLSTQQRGIIIMIHPYDPLYALVKTDEGIIDLKENKEVKIVQVYS